MSRATSGLFIGFLLLKSLGVLEVFTPGAKIQEIVSCIEATRQAPA